MTLRCTQYSAVLISRYAHYIAGRNGQSLCRDKTHLLTHDDVCRVCVRAGGFTPKTTSPRPIRLRRRPLQTICVMCIGTSNDNMYTPHHYICSIDTQTSTSDV